MNAKRLGTRRWQAVAMAFLVALSVNSAWSAEVATESAVTLVERGNPVGKGVVVGIDAEVRHENGAVRVHAPGGALRPGVTFTGPGGRWNLAGRGE